MPLNLAAIANLRQQLVQAAADEARDSILAPAVEGIPKETETAAKSGRIVVDGDTIYVTFGLDTDSNPKTGQPSNTYIEPLHEDMEAHHANGHAQFLRTAANQGAPGFADRVARRLGT